MVFTSRFITKSLERQLSKVHIQAAMKIQPIGLNNVKIINIPRFYSTAEGSTKKKMSIWRKIVWTFYITTFVGGTTAGAVILAVHNEDFNSKYFSKYVPFGQNIIDLAKSYVDMEKTHPKFILDRINKSVNEVIESPSESISKTFNSINEKINSIPIPEPVLNAAKSAKDLALEQSTKLANNLDETITTNETVGPAYTSVKSFVTSVNDYVKPTKKDEPVVKAPVKTTVEAIKVEEPNIIKEIKKEVQQEVKKVESKVPTIIPFKHYLDTESPTTPSLIPEGSDTSSPKIVKLTEDILPPVSLGKLTDFDKDSKINFKPVSSESKGLAVETLPSPNAGKLGFVAVPLPESEIYPEGKAPSKVKEAVKKVPEEVKELVKPIEEVKDAVVADSTQAAKVAKSKANDALKEASEAAVASAVATRNVVKNKVAKLEAKASDLKDESKKEIEIIQSKFENKEKDIVTPLAEKIEDIENLDKNSIEKKFKELKNSDLISVNISTLDINELVDIIESLKERLQEEIKNDKEKIDELKKQFKIQRENDTKQLIDNYQRDLESSLLVQSQEYEARFEDELRKAFELSQIDRLQQLDTILLKMKYLERASGENLERLNNAILNQHLSSYLQCLKHAINIDHQKPLVKEFKLLEKVSNNIPLVNIVLNSISENSINFGVKSSEELKREYKSLEPEIRKVELMPDYGGPFAYFLSRTLSPILLKKEGLVSGNDVEAILARTRYYLDKNDLYKATYELNQLTGWPRRIAVDWLTRSRSRLEILQAVDTLDTYLELKSVSAI